MNTKAIAVALMCAVALSGCNGSEGDDVGGHAAASSSAPDDAGVAVAPGDDVKVRGARPVTSVASELAEIPQDAPKAVLAVDRLGDDGSVLFSRSPDDGDIQDVGQGRLEVATAPGEEATPVPLGPRREADQQTTQTDLTSQWIVWQETASTDLMVEPWVMYAFDRQTGKTTEVTSVEAGRGETPLAPPGWTGPQVLGDRVVWAEGIGDGDGTTRVDVMGCTLPTCADRETLIAGAAFPSLTEKGIYAVAHPGYRDPAKEQGPFRLVHLEPGEDQPTVVREIPLERESFTGFTTDGSSFVWTLDGRNRGKLVHWDGEETTTLTTGKYTQAGYPALGDDLVVWAEGSGGGSSDVGGFVYDLRSGEVFTAGNQSGLYGIDAAGRRIYFQRDSSDGISSVIVELPG